jgi:pimeloyl-ACP methyl ester carboxylesterase
MTTTDSQRLHILGSEVRYWVYNPGATRTLVMIHGFRGNHHGLHDIIQRLPEVRVIIPDLPGFGESTPMTRRQHDINGYRDFVGEFITQLGLEKPALLGHSFGSIIAASFAATSPQRISKLILINSIATPALKGPRTVFSYGAKLFYQIGAALPERAGRALLSNRLVVLGTSQLLAKTKDKALRRDIHQHHIQHFSSFQTRDALLQAFDASISHTVLAFAPHIHVPTLLVAGARDDIAPSSGQYELERQLPDARLLVIPDVGHLIHREAPRAAAEAITQFLG